MNYPAALEFDIIFAMEEDSHYQVPRTSTLIAFESTARLGNVTRAATALGSSQSAVSRQIATLESQLQVRLFHRSRSGVQLTEAGRRFYNATVAALGLLHAGFEEAAADCATGKSMVIACAHDASHLLFMPRYDALAAHLGEGVRTRFLTYQRHVEELAPVPVADVVLSWRVSNAAPEDQVLIMEEEVRPVCSPGYAAAHADAVNGPARGWGRLTLLDLKLPNMGWVTWQDWFRVVGHPDSAPSYEEFDSYTLVLQAAVDGRGVALGWRHYIEQYFDVDTLVPLHDGFVKFTGRFVAALTPRGRNNLLAHKCLEFFDGIA